MSALTDPRIEALQRQAGANGELDFAVGEGCFRINLRDENIALWQETFEQTNTPANLLLACDKNTGALNTTKLTWVVGSAIRGSTEPDAQSVVTLLGQMGVSKALAQAAADHCPGLGQNLVWAFYLERHGWLIATPVAQVSCE